MIKGKKYNSLKLKLSKWILAGKSNKVMNNTQACSLERAKSVGITFTATSPAELDEIKKFLKELASRNIKTIALGYIPEKKPTDFYLSEKSFNFFYDKELDWLLQPKSQAALEFQDTEFDILIDFGTLSYYPMEILLRNSRARFKVGFYTENSPFDLMINIKDTDNYKYYFEQVVHYLSKFN